MTQTSLPQEVQNTILALSEAVNKIQEHVASLLKCPLDDLTSQLTEVETAKLNTLLAYTLNALYYIYLKTRGVPPAEHAVKKELDRIKHYMEKVKELSNKERPNLRLNQEAANRFISNALQDVKESERKRKKPDQDDSDNDSENENHNHEDRESKRSKATIKNHHKKRKSPAKTTKEKKEKKDKKEKNAKKSKVLKTEKKNIKSPKKKQKK